MARRRRLYLICYDIAEDPKRLSRVARYLSKFAFRVQYSVFVGSFFEHSLNGVLRGLEAIIDPSKDDVRCYPLPDRAEVVLMGPQMFPDDILLIRDGCNLLRLGEDLQRICLREPAWVGSEDEGDAGEISGPMADAP
ncbi:MAG: CRISPR-associated endonuclease Cas2 [Candidatus Competibacteraceae bacterium]|nr:CRISPR-associated endonuclease Cas2 [Candidatus Competibacteraceae bacterium]MBK8964191.1 CRISPR-associated endonuclease Cas2 [Candidatus Competibacteraceae bacterium]